MRLDPFCIDVLGRAVQKDGRMKDGACYICSASMTR